LEVTRENINRNRRENSELILMEECEVQQEEQAAWKQYQCHNLIFQRTILRKLEKIH